MRIIPAIDIIDGKCVRLTQGDYNQKKIYNENPLAVAKEFEAKGIRYLHLVDLDGAKAKTPKNLSILEAICTQTSLQVDFGGGIKTKQAIQDCFSCGANQITLGSIAAKNKIDTLTWLKEFGGDKIILGADCKNRKIAIDGWQNTTEAEVIDFIQQYVSEGIKYTICTDVAKDGMLQGTSLELYKEIIATIPQIKLIASGGVANFKDLLDLQNIGCEGVIIGKAIYENKISLKELSQLC